MDPVLFATSLRVNKCLALSHAKARIYTLYQVKMSDVEFSKKLVQICDVVEQYAGSFRHKPGLMQKEYRAARLNLDYAEFISSQAKNGSRICSLCQN